MTGKISRRQLIAYLGTALGLAGLFQAVDRTNGRVHLPNVQGGATPTPTQTNTPRSTATSKPQPAATNTPIPSDTPVPGAPKVVHVHSPNATSWDFSSGWYGDYVNQNQVNNMVDRGVMALTNTTSRDSAWRAILPAYVVGQKIAIKINLNNAQCNDGDNVIDALPQPINSVIKGLKAIGVAEDDIVVYDVSNGAPANGGHSGQMPARLVNKVRTFFPNVQFHSTSGSCSTELGYSPVEKIHFNVPPGKPSISDRSICNALVTATYLINMPIMKKHGWAGVTLAFKNHFGSFERCDYLHWSIKLGEAAYSSTYSVLVDIYNNSHFRNKTVLTIGDGLFGGKVNNYETPSRWSTFGDDAPNSLFFARDPVAIDSVMCDFLDAEGGIHAGSDDYLKLAAAAGLGVFERGQPRGSGYSRINYTRIEL